MHKLRPPEQRNPRSANRATDQPRFVAQVRHLARVELEIALNTLVLRWPRLTLAVPADKLHWRPSFRSWGLRQLPVTL